MKAATGFAVAVAVARYEPKIIAPEVLRLPTHRLLNYNLSRDKSCMPELPEVETVVKTLQPVIVGRRVRRVELSRTDIVVPAGADLESLITGRTVRDISRRAKRIVFLLDNGHRFYIHLGMSGRITLSTADEPMAPHTHFRLLFDAGPEMRFRDPRRFGGIWWLGADGDEEGKIGPEPLLLRSKELAARLIKTRRAIKTALLDQSLIAGLGNIYVDESLFAAGLHPAIAANQLTNDDVARLTRSIKTTLRRALRHRGSTLRDYRDANDESGAFQRLHRVYDRAAAPCWKCRGKIVRVVMGGRSTHFCPVCQPARKANRGS